MAKVFLGIHRGSFCWIIVLFLLVVQGTKERLNETQDESSSKIRTPENCYPKEHDDHKRKKRRALDMEKDECKEEDMEHCLIHTLLKGYNKNVRPVKKKSEAIQVAFDIAYSQLVDLDGRKQILTSKIWVRQFWKNEFLTWNKTKYSGIGTLQVNPKLIWKPDIVLYNSIGLSSSGEMYKFDTMINVHSDGTNEWFAPTEIKSICPIEITYFPFDYQKCYLKFGSWTYSRSFLNFTIKRSGSADLSMYHINGEWELLGVPAERHVVKYSCCEDPFVDVTYKLILKRKVLFYLNNLVIPNLILAGLVICSFYVPPESGERISFNITILLGLTVFLLLFNERIPPSSEVVPLIGSYYFTLFYQVAVSVILTSVTSRCYHHNPFREMPRWLRVLIFRVLAPLFRMQNRYAAQKQNVTTTWQPHDVKCKKHQQPLLYKSTNGSFKITDDLVTESTPNHGNSNSHNVILESKMEDISKQLEVFVDHLKRNEELESKRDEWHFASIVLDKLFFWFFLSSIFLTTLLFYMKIERQRPNHNSEF